MGELACFSTQISTSPWQNHKKELGSAPALFAFCSKSWHSKRQGAITWQNPPRPMWPLWLFAFSRGSPKIPVTFPCSMSADARWGRFSWTGNRPRWSCTTPSLSQWMGLRPRFRSKRVVSPLLTPGTHGSSTHLLVTSSRWVCRIEVLSLLSEWQRPQAPSPPTPWGALHILTKPHSPYILPLVINYSSGVTPTLVGAKTPVSGHRLEEISSWFTKEIIFTVPQMPFTQEHFFIYSWVL